MPPTPSCMFDSRLHCFTTQRAALRVPHLPRNEAGNVPLSAVKLVDARDSKPAIVHVLVLARRAAPPVRGSILILNVVL